jgi:hypothetical protein
MLCGGAEVDDVPRTGLPRWPRAKRELRFCRVNGAAADILLCEGQGGRVREKRLSVDASRAASHGGPLYPVREGWLLRRVEGYRPWAMLPPSYRRRTLFWALAPLVLLDLLSMALGGPPVLVCVGFLVALKGSRPIADALLRRSLERQPCREQLAGRARGETVRVQGRVRPGPCFASVGGRWPSVLAAYAGTAMHPAGRNSARSAARFGGKSGGKFGGKFGGKSGGKSGGKRGRRRRRTRPWAEIRGMDFLVDLPGGETVVVSARDAYLLAPNALIDVASCRMVDVVTAPLGRVVRKDDEGTVIESVLAELVVGPGDEVEIYGVLDWEVNQAAAASPGRTGALAPVIRSSAQVPLVVRPRALGRS